jgi:hypothetical protein
VADGGHESELAQDYSSHHDGLREHTGRNDNSLPQRNLLRLTDTTRLSSTFTMLIVKKSEEKMCLVLGLPSAWTRYSDSK